MKTVWLCTAALCALELSFAQQAPPAAPAAASPSPDSVVLTIGEAKMTRAQFELFISGLSDQMKASAANQAGKRQLAQQLGELIGIAQEARKRKLDQSPAVQQMITIQADQVLANTLVRQISSDLQPDDGALHAYYDSHKAQYEQCKASHILIRFKGSQAPLKPNQKDLSEEEAMSKAQELRKKLLAGADFATIAKAESDDGGSAERGGSLGTFGHGEMVAAFDQAAFALPIGEISEPIKTPFGYHLIKVEGRSAKSFEEAKPEIEKQIKPQLTREALDKIRNQTPVTLDENYFGK